jgi:predicted transposase YbfD/YdcC
LALKGNQETLLHQAVIDPIEEESKDGFAQAKARFHLSEETGHGRDEIRSYLQMPAPKKLKGLERWKGLKSIGMATLVCVRNGKETTERRYYISSLPMGVKQFARAIRSHWGIENGCHWSLDMIYREDESRIREPNLRENFAWLNRFTLSLLKQHPDDKQSTMMKRRSCGWSDEFMLEVITGTAP